MMIRIPIEPVPADVTPGDYVGVELRRHYPDRIALSVNDEIPGECAELLITPDEARRVIAALEEGIRVLSKKIDR